MLVNRADLCAQLASVRRAIRKDHPVEILRNFCIRQRHLLGYNSEIGIVAECQLPWDVCVPAETLWGVVRDAPSELDLDLSGSKLVVKSGGSTIRLGTVAATSYPNFLPKQVEDFLAPAVFAEAMSAIGEGDFGEDDPKFLGVGIRGNNVWLTDGNRITCVRISQQAPCEVVLPLPLTKLLADDGVPTRVFYNSNLLGCYYESSKTLLIGAMLAKKYPFGTLERAFSPCNRIYTYRLPDGLPDELRRMQAAGGKRAGQAVHFGGTNGQLHFRLETETAEAEYRTAWDLPPDAEFNIKVDALWLREILSRATHVNLENVLKGDRRHLRFLGNGFEHLLALRA